MRCEINSRNRRSWSLFNIVQDDITHKPRKTNFATRGHVGLVQVSRSPGSTFRQLRGYSRHTTTQRQRQSIIVLVTCNILVRTIRTSSDWQTSSTSSRRGRRWRRLSGRSSPARRDNTRSTAPAGWPQSGEMDEIFYTFFDRIISPHCGSNSRNSRPWTLSDNGIVMRYKTQKTNLSQLQGILALFLLSLFFNVSFFPSLTSSEKY